MVGLIVLRAQMPLDWKPWAERRLQALPLLQEACASGQPVITDNQFLAFAAGCRVPPSLADTSVKRIDARLLSESTVTDVLLRQQIPLVLVDTLQFGDLLEVERGWRVISSQSTCFEETCLYYPDRELLNPTLTPETLVGEAVRLWGYTLKGTFEPGETPQVVLYWESVTPVQENWKVFVHLMDDAGDLVAQHDGVPFAEASPTSTWRAGERIIDPHALELPADLPPGSYQVVVGMYREATAERLSAVSAGERWPNDGIIVTEVEVRP